MTTKCLIVDDEPLAIELIRRHIQQVKKLEIVATRQYPKDALALLHKVAIDLIFLDIQMPMLTGIEFLKSLTHPPAVIFTTAYRDYAIEAYELNVIDYLLKPIAFQRFFKAINKYFDHLKVEKHPPSPETLPEWPRDFIYIKDSRRTFRVQLADIRYIESLRDYIKIHLADKQLVTKEKISDFAQKLPPNFLRIHRSFIVNLNHIKAFTANNIEIHQIVVPIGIRYRQKVQERLR